MNRLISVSECMHFQSAMHLTIHIHTCINVSKLVYELQLIESSIPAQVSDISV